MIPLLCVRTVLVSLWTPLMLPRAAIAIRPLAPPRSPPALCLLAMTLFTLTMGTVNRQNIMLPSTGYMRRHSILVLLGAVMMAQFPPLKVLVSAPCSVLLVLVEFRLVFTVRVTPVKLELMFPKAMT